jgi:3-hydroxyacyl-[acyl-carrier-protein] dehydratase
MPITLNINQIKQYLPHRYPFLFIDAVEDCVPGEWLIGRKAITGNEDFFNGHFPGNPVVPGVIQLEAMAQAGALLAILSGVKIDASRSIYVATINDCKFRRPVVPGDVLHLHAKILRYRLGTYRLGCEARVNGETASEAVFSATSGPRASDPTIPPNLPPPSFPNAV